MGLASVLEAPSGPDGPFAAEPPAPSEAPAAAASPVLIPRGELDALQAATALKKMSVVRPKCFMGAM